MKQHASWLFAVSLVMTDALMAGLAFAGGYFLRLQSEYENINPFSSYWGMLFIHVLIIVVIFFFYRLYHRHRAQSHVEEFYAVFGAASVGTIVGIAVISLIFKDSLDYPRLMMVYTWVLTILLVTLGRVVHARFQWRLQARGYNETRLLIVGAGDIGRMILQNIRQSPGLGYIVVGFVDDRDPPATVLGSPVLGKTDDIPQLIEAHHANEVIIALPDASHQEILSIIARCEREKITIKVFPDVFQIMASEVSISDLNGLPLLTVRDIALRGWNLALKRAVDIAGSAAALIFLSPLMTLTAILIKLDSPGPVFYVQERMGLDARPFMILKFRSMRPDAEAETGPVWASAGDPRRTRLGAFIRRFSIDEFPQFINVLIGDMSLVGPRPERPVFVEQFKKSIPRYMDRHKEKAGLTGWAQINGLRGDTSIIERTKYDLWYIENWSLLLDLRIIIRTALNLFEGDNQGS
jgi:exopolysaccharide biosynthesis polyprenyl glycosylphosphotransferase